MLRVGCLEKLVQLLTAKLSSLARVSSNSAESVAKAKEYLLLAVDQIKNEVNEINPTLTHKYTHIRAANHELEINFAKLKRHQQNRTLLNRFRD